MADQVTECRICRNKNLTTIYDLGNQALGSRFPTVDQPEPMSAPLILVKCDGDNSCGLLQLSHNVSSDELYLQSYGYRSGLNNTMITHLSGLVSEIESKVDLLDGDIVLDIGSNDCTLLKSYTNGDKLQRVGIDPTGTQFKDYYPDSVCLVPKFFNAAEYKNSFGDQKAKVVTSVSMFYDLPDPLIFSRDIKEILHEDGIWVTEQSYCMTMLERNSFDTICHEHLEYYMLKQLQYIADNVGFVITDVSLNDCNGGSFRVTLRHSGTKYQHLDQMLEIESKVTNDELQEFVKRCDKMKDELVTFISDKVAQGKTVYLYGASTKGNTLLQYYGLDNSLITAAAERNTEKYGRRTPKTNIPIIPESEMREANPDYLLVLPWHFKTEFLQREHEYLENGGHIIFPLPNMEIYDKNNSIEKKY